MAESRGVHEQAGLMPIGAVVAELRSRYPDVSHSSLRFLEREGLIEPVRTPGGHRLFAPDDVDRIRRIKEWQRQRLSLDEIRERLRAAPEPAALSRRLLDRFVARDLAAARRLVLEADDAGLPLAVTFGDVMQPALQQVGVLWERGDLLVAQEKEISEASRDLIAVLSTRHAAADPQGPSLVAACVEGERHELGLRMVCGLLRAAGRPVHYLGADVAPRFLSEALRLRQPAAVLLSAKLEADLPAIKQALDLLRLAPDAPLAIPALVGGQAAVDHADQLRLWGATPIVEARPADAAHAVELLIAASALATE